MADVELDKDEAVALNARTMVAPILPIAIQHNMVHMHMSFRTSFNDPSKVVQVNRLVDTGAALTTGSLNFCLHFAKCFPWIRADITVANGTNYTGNVVKSDTLGATSAKLPVLFRRCTPYRLASDSQSS